jgi:hypothetical protein
MITTQDLTDLAGMPPGTTLSFYLPTSPSGPTTLQAATHLKNLRQQAHGLLEGEGHSSRDADAFLAPIDQLIQNEAFWQHQRHGLVVFLTESGHQLFPLENTVEPDVFLGNTAEITPLLDQLTSEDSFLVVTLSHDHASIYLGNQRGLSPLDVASLPGSINEVAGGAHKESTSYAAPTERPHIGQVSFAHGQSYGDSPSEWEESRRVLYAELVQKALQPLLTSSHLPSVLVADEDLGGEVAKKLSFTATNHTHPASLDEKALHALALEALAPHHATTAHHDAERILERVGRGDLVATTLEDILQAALEGRVQTLVVSTTTPDKDLTAALHHTLTTGGTLHYLDNPTPPFPQGAIALLRY